MAKSITRSGRSANTVPAIWRILRILDEEGVKATFNTCGGSAERYPDEVKASRVAITNFISPVEVRAQLLKNVLSERGEGFAPRAAGSLKMRRHRIATRF